MTYPTEHIHMRKSILLWIFLFCSSVTVYGWGIFKRQSLPNTAAKPAFQGQPTNTNKHEGKYGRLRFLKIINPSSTSPSSSLLEAKTDDSSSSVNGARSTSAAATTTTTTIRKGATKRFRRAKDIVKKPVDIVRKPIVVMKEKRKRRKEQKILFLQQQHTSDGDNDDHNNLDGMTYVQERDLNGNKKNNNSDYDPKEEATEVAGVVVGDNSNDQIIISNVHELRKEVFDNGKSLAELDFNVSCFRTTKKTKKGGKQQQQQQNANAVSVNGQSSRSSTSTSITSTISETNIPIVDEDEEPLFNHEVIKLIEKRFNTKSKPGSRPLDDNAHLSLSIEGGGMRGAVSAGMASAIAVLGLSDCFDSIYGSSAGSVVGAYMVSRQMCIDVYTQVITTAKSKFVSKKRLASSLASNYIDQALNSTIFARNMNPAMNISFVLDSIMCPEQGLRPLDVDMFQLNDQKQQLRIVTSCVRDGKMETHCLGSRNLDFFDRIDKETGEVVDSATTMVDGSRHGLFACLETSMTVPAATGPPLPLLRHKDAQANMTSMCFDAFCYEPIPYRSAVKEGATHVLVLKTRPEGNPIGTKPGLFENVFAPMYFNANGLSQVSEYFENGGQQYIYVEDYLTLDEGKKAGKDGVLVPPTKILYGIEKDDEAKSFIENRNEWKKAHLLPLSVPAGTPELSTLSVDTMEVLTAVKGGFAVAFDLLAPCTGIELDSHLNGERVAELLFAANGTKSTKDILRDPVSVAGDLIKDQHDQDTMSAMISNNEVLVKMTETSNETPCAIKDSVNLLGILPGFQNGKMVSLAGELQYRVKQLDDEK